MDSKRLVPGDERNMPFAPQNFKAADATAGFDAGEQEVERNDSSECHNRFPTRKSQAEIPRESIAERLRRQHQGG
jgi:hypothetical protein